MAASSSPTLGREGIPQTNKSYTIPSTGHTYAYIYHPAKDEGGDGKGGKGKKATLLWLHGFPSTSAGEFHGLFFNFLMNFLVLNGRVMYCSGLVVYTFIEYTLGIAVYAYLVMLGGEVSQSQVQYLPSSILSNTRRYLLPTTQPKIHIYILHIMSFTQT